jgi:hypothetical protein
MNSVVRLVKKISLCNLILDLKPVESSVVPGLRIR